MKTLYIHFVIVLLLALVAVPNSLRAGSFTFDFEHPNAVGSSFADAVPLNTPGALTDSLGQPIGFTHSPIGATSFSDATLTPLGLEFEICGDACSINLAIPFPTDGSGIVQITARWSGISSMDVDFDQLGVGIAESNSCCDASAGMLYAITFHNGGAFLGPILYQIAGPFNFSATAAHGEQDIQSVTLSAPTIPGGLVTGIFDGASIDATLVQFVDNPANTRLGRADTFAYVFMLDSSDFHGGVSIPLSGILKSVSFSGPKVPPGDIDGVTEVVIFGSTNFGPEGDSMLHRIDPLTGVATAVGTGIGFQRVSMDFDPTTGILYATGEREAGDLDVNVLLTINPSTGVGTEIGPTGTDGFQGAGTPPGLITDISFQPFDQTLFAWAYPGEWVATIDLVSGAGTQLAFSPGFLQRGITANSGNALAFLESGILVHAATDFFPPGFPGALHEIDFATTPANQMATVLASLSFPISPVFPAERFARANGMDFDFANGTLFASIVYSFGPTRHNFLGTIDTTTGDVTLIGQTKTRMDALTVISSVDIDIKPGSDRNPVAPNSNGVVMLAILGTSDFDALQVSTSTMRFGPLEATPERCNVRDTNRDGIMDLSCRFKIPETGIACGDTEATLVGATFGGEPIIGTDTVNTVGCPPPVVAEYVNDFSSSVGPASLFGDAVLDSGSVRLTDSINGQLGSLVIDDLIPGGAVASFTATFDHQTGPGSVPPADGISFNLGPLPNSAFGEEGTFSGLTIAFDTFDNPGPDAVGIDVRVNGAIVATNPTNPFTNSAFVSVSVVFDSDGTLDLTFDGAPIFINLPTGFTPASGDRFGFGGRTGGLNEVNRIDNVSIFVVPQ